MKSLLTAALLGIAALPQSGTIEHLVFDARIGAMVIVESSREAGRQRIWRLDGGEWRLLDASGPPVRELEAATYDTARQRLIMHGGMVANGGDTSLAELWEFDGRAWSQPAAQGPGARDHHTMVYDPDRRRIVLFGGRVSREQLGIDTWEYDGTAWRRFEVPGPGGRAHFPMVYDTVRKRVLLFGGMDSESRARNDLWAWDGHAWTKLAEGGPPGRTHHRMAFDQRTGSLVVFGGQRGTAAFGDTWVWNGTTWTEVPASPDGPIKRGGHVMAWDPTRNQIIMLGGGYFDGKTSHHHSDLWGWNGRRWEPLGNRGRLGRPLVSNW
jgi:hypothetical protein